MTLGEPIRKEQPKPAEDWKPYYRDGERVPGFEVNRRGQIRTAEPPPPKPAGVP